MAELAEPELVFEGCCPDCGDRRAVLPAPLPGVEDDFDWRARDYDSFRLFLMQELAHRFPARSRWTPADMEVVVVELLAAALDRASHALDAVQAERYLDTARRPESVRRLLKLVGYDAVERIDLDLLDAASPVPLGVQVERYWRDHPAAMEAARRAGPLLTGEQRRMVTLEDHETLLVTHPLVARARAGLLRSSAWNTILISTLLEGARELDGSLHAGPAATAGTRPDGLPEKLWKEIVAFHKDARLDLPPTNTALTPRRLLSAMIERYRMVGSEVFLEAAKPAPITFALSVRALRGYFRSELKHALDAVLSSEEGGFFEPGGLGFGEDVYASDLIEVVMAVEGVETVCLNRFKRLGAVYPDRVSAGFIPIADDEFALCMNAHADPASGTYRIRIDGGETA